MGWSYALNLVLGIWNWSEVCVCGLCVGGVVWYVGWCGNIIGVGACVPLHQLEVERAPVTKIGFEL